SPSCNPPPNFVRTQHSRPRGAALEGIGMLAIEYGYWLPFDASTHGAPIDKMMIVIHIMMALIFFGWGAFFVYCLAKFRARPGHKATYEPVRGTWSKGIELAIIVAEAVLLVG